MMAIQLVSYTKPNYYKNVHKHMPIQVLILRFLTMVLEHPKTKNINIDKFILLLWDISNPLYAK